MVPCLTHWGGVTHICVSKLSIIDSDNGLSPGRHQAIIWTKCWNVLNFISSAKWRPFCLGLNVLTILYTRPDILHYNDVIMGTIASQITSLTIVYSTVYSGADQRKHQSSESLAFVRGIHRGPVNSPHKWPVTRKMSPFDDVIMNRYFPKQKICWYLIKIMHSKLNDASNCVWSILV